MTLPRSVRPDRCYLITRRCAQREFLLRPSAEVNNAFIYCLAYAAQRCEIDIVATCAMSNHHHTVIYDRAGRYPEFLEQFHKLLARCLNFRFKRRENFWSAEQVSVVWLVGGADILDKVAYTILNPIVANLVERAHQWPGVMSYHALLSGEPLRATRPTFFFKQEDTQLPAEVELAMTIPDQLGVTAKAKVAARARIRELVVEEEEAHIARRRRKGIRVLGAKKVLEASRSRRGTREETHGELSPGIAAKDPHDRIQALRARKEFLAAYRAARGSMLERKHGTRRRQRPFPAGTWWLTRHTAVPVIAD